jgi:hypothetical protein
VSLLGHNIKVVHTCLVVLTIANKYNLELNYYYYYMSDGDQSRIMTCPVPYKIDGLDDISLKHK